jgi:hypothetical protein
MLKSGRIGARPLLPPGSSAPLHSSLHADGPPPPLPHARRQPRRPPRQSHPRASLLREHNAVALIMNDHRRLARATSTRSSSSTLTRRRVFMPSVGTTAHRYPFAEPCTTRGPTARLREARSRAALLRRVRQVRCPVYSICASLTPVPCAGTSRRTTRCARTGRRRSTRSAASSSASRPTRSRRPSARPDSAASIGARPKPKRRRRTRPWRLSQHRHDLFAGLAPSGELDFLSRPP